MAKIIFNHKKNQVNKRILPIGFGVELHYGGADGKQPHKDGSSQDVHGKKGSGVSGIKKISADKTKTVEVGKFEAKQFMKEIKQWDAGEDSARRGIGMKAMFSVINGDANGLALVDENGLLKGASCFTIETADVFPVSELPQSEYLHINYLATKEAGYGRKFMGQYIKEAKSKGVGIILLSASDATGFYEKLGMKQDESESGFYYWTQDDVSNLSINTLLEPSNGVFVVKEKKKLVMNNEFVFCLICHSPRDMSDKGLVEKCEQCGDEEYVRSDFYVPDGEPFYGYIDPK